MTPKSIFFLILSFIFEVCSATFDINSNQLQMVADNLKLAECRKLSESLHEKGFELSHLLTGEKEPKDVSCLSLLQHWNTQESEGQTFHQLATRLKQLGRHDLAGRLSLSVSDEKVGEVRDLFLNDPFRSRIHTNSPLLQESPHVEKKSTSKKKDDNAWTGFEIAEVAIFVLVAATFLFISALTFIRVFLPDSFARMRASLYESFTGKRPGDEDLFFIM